MASAGAGTSENSYAAAVTPAHAYPRLDAHAKGDILAAGVLEVDDPMVGRQLQGAGRNGCFTLLRILY